MDMKWQPENRNTERIERREQETQEERAHERGGKMATDSTFDVFLNSPSKHRDKKLVRVKSAISSLGQPITTRLHL